MSTLNENEVLRHLKKFMEEKTLNGVDSRRLINAVIRDELTTWQYLKVKIPVNKHAKLKMITVLVDGYMFREKRKTVHLVSEFQN